MLVHKITPHKEAEGGWYNKQIDKHYTGEDWDDYLHRTYPNRNAHRKGTWVPHKEERIIVDLPMPGGGVIHHQLTENSGKITYGRWLGTLAFKRGDWVVNKASQFPYIEGNYLRVVNLVEMWPLVKWDHKGRPMALELKSSKGTAFTSAPVEWMIVDPPTNEDWKFDLGPY